jgi:ABC-type multidrug transport system fused ATPase/permease subunit
MRKAQQTASRLAAYRRVVSLFLRNMPYDSICAAFYYIFDNFSPAVHTIILAGLFNAAYRLLNAGAAEPRDLIRFGVAFVLFNLVKQILQILSSISINAGIYEKTFQILKTRIAVKSSKLALISYEDNRVLDIKKRAEECVNNDRLPGIYMLGIVLSTSIFGIVSLFITLWYYYWALALIVILSTGQFFAAAYLTGKQKYAQNERLTVRRRKRDYIWSLFFDKRYLKEMRLLGFDGYLKEKWGGVHDSINREVWGLELKESRRLMFCDGIKLCGYVCGIVLSLILLVNNRITVGVFGACIAALFTMQDSIKQFFSSIGRLPHFLDLANDYFNYINLPEADTGGLEYHGIKNIITVQDVDFTYPGSKNKTLKDINLAIEAGKSLSSWG